MELIITEDNPKILEVYSYDNYKVEYSPLCKNNRCIIFFSGNGLYYPDTIECFNETIVENDRYEWNTVGHADVILKKYSMIIYVRDVFKSWYEKGISVKCNTIDKVIELLREICDGYEIVTCGNSAGGYMACIVGNELHAELIFDFGGQWCPECRFRDENKDNIVVNKYYDITRYATNRVLYFFSAKAQYDLVQLEFVLECQSENGMRILPIDSTQHGYLLWNVCYQYILSLDKCELDKIISIFEGKIIKQAKYAKKLLPFREYVIAYSKYVISCHKSFQIISEVMHIDWKSAY